ncbi:MAG TPA: hypothetical protein VIS51_06790 [Solirubrobacterales bacterium]
MNRYGRVLGGRLALIVGATLLFVQPAAAATVVNGDFETGTLAGWAQVPAPEAGGGWFSYSGIDAPVSTESENGEKQPRTIQPPPQGGFAVISDQIASGTGILFQDIALEPGMTHTLSLITYYNSLAPITVPTPGSLSPEGFGQQYRIDVMKPSASIYSVDPVDILSTVFRTGNGDPGFSPPLALTVDLTPFAGQVVRLRVAEVDNLGYLNAGVDAISIQSTPIPPSSFSFGRFKLNRERGTATLKVDVPWAGKVMAVDLRKIKRIATVTARTAAAGTATLRLRPTYLFRERLESRDKLPFKLRVTFTPTGGAAATQIFSGQLKLRPRH